MSVTAVSGLLTAAAGLIVAVTGLIAALRAHSRIEAMQSPPATAPKPPGTK